MNRNLDGCYFRVYRAGKWKSVCFSDLTEEEMDEVLKNKKSEWLRNLCKYLGKRIASIGNEFNLKGEE